jgi:DNA sulfur modification protein DndB
MQIRVLGNYFKVLKDWYASKWDSPMNPFLSAAGFNGAIEFFCNKLVPYCNTKRSFTSGTIQAALRLEPSNLIDMHEIKGFQGRVMFTKIAELLTERFHPEANEGRPLEI